MAARDRPSLPRTRKRFGQHFLTDPRILDRIVDALAPDRSSTVVEIGPGRGALTDRLAARAGRVVAIEIDRDLARALRDRYREPAVVEVIEADALEVNWGQVAGGPYLLAGNLPYYITTPLLFRALEPPRAERAVVLVQREVADRIVAPPGSKNYGALSVNVQLLATAETVLRVGAGAFHPRPTVDSAVVRLVPREPALVAAGEEAGLRRFTQGIFGFRRKQMVRVLRELRGLSAEAAQDVLRSVGIAAEVRPETLLPEDFLRLFRAVLGDG